MDYADKQTIDRINNRIDGLCERIEELEDIWLNDDDVSKEQTKTDETHGYHCPCDKCRHEAKMNS